MRILRTSQSGGISEYTISLSNRCIMDVFLYKILEADVEEINTSTGKQRRFDISSAHGFAALSYALLPYAFVHEFFDNNVGCNIMTKMPRFARRRLA